jgi:SAM-dependent methyltransferase
MVFTSHLESVLGAETFGTGGHWPRYRLASSLGVLVDAGLSVARTMRVEGIALTRLGHQWNTLGLRDPLGAVLTKPSTASAWDVEEFFATGRSDVDRLMRDVAGRAPGLSTRRALDFGCGVGRLTQALANHFAEVRGVDVAESMIARARQENRAHGRCHFEVNRQPHLRRFKTGSFDLAYSRLVLQHMPPQLVSRYIPELVRVLAPGGLLVFQLPSVIADPRRAFCEAPVRGRLKRALPRRLVQAYRRAKYPFQASDMDMFGMMRDRVVRLVEAAGARVLAMTSDAGHGTSVPGFEYGVTKSTPV